MNVLNTTGGGIDVWAVIAILFFAILALVFLFLSTVAFADNEKGVAVVVFLMALLFGAVSLAAYSDRFEPVRYEVTLQPGYVIDATKYDIVKQRGEIYVIEVREATE
jgi:hypothetical protein